MIYVKPFNFSILAIIKACNDPSHRWFCGVLQIAFYSPLHRFGHCPLTDPVKSILEGFLTFTPRNESCSLAILIRHVSINIKFTAQKLQWHTRYENEWRKHIKMVTNYPFFQPFKPDAILIPIKHESVHQISQLSHLLFESSEDMDHEHRFPYNNQYNP